MQGNGKEWMRIGSGYDMHRLVAGRKLILGGVEIPFEKGLLGHSDADVLLHAVCDALMGAAGLGDIGLHFPDADPQYKNIDSMKLLSRTAGLLRKNGWRILNADATILAQAPRISSYRDSMRDNIALALELEADRINVKATTTEGLGPIGRGEGIGAMCTALIEKFSENEDDKRMKEP